jgi:hypothetical protein
MAPAPLVKIGATSAAEICARVQLPRDALALLRQGMGPRDFVQALLDGKKYVAGVDFVAHALPPREGIWWGCLCVQRAYGDTLSPADRAAAIAAVQWVLRPGEEAGAAARRPAETAGPKSAAGAHAAAAFLTSGNAASSRAVSSVSGPFATAKAVGKAVKIASLQGPPAKIPHTQRAMVELGLCVAEGRYI